MIRRVVRRIEVGRIGAFAGAFSEFEERWRTMKQ